MVADWFRLPNIFDDVVRAGIRQWKFKATGYGWASESSVDFNVR
jgi:hypothetical protein